MSEKFALKFARIHLFPHEFDRIVEPIRTGAILMTDGARHPAEGRMETIGDPGAASGKDAAAAAAREFGRGVLDVVLTRADAARPPPAAPSVSRVPAPSSREASR